MNLNNAPRTALSQRRGDSGLPLSNRGVGRSDKAQQAVVARAADRTWGGIDWVSGSVDLFMALDEAGWTSPMSGDALESCDHEVLSAHLASFGPKPKDPCEHADADGVLEVDVAQPFQPPSSLVDQVARSVFDFLFAGTGLVLATDARPGKFYAFRYLIRNVWDEPAGMIEVGGSMTLRKGGRPSLRFELTGLGCAILEQRGDPSADHAQPWCALRAKLERVGTLLSRTDIAFDDLDGTRSLERAICMWQLGEFDYRFAGELHRPKARSISDHGSGEGSTFYVGHSSSAKQLRVYEKGKQLGDTESPWVRWELQMRGSTRKRLTLDVLTKPLDYMRGAYECLDFVSRCLARLEVTQQASKASIKSVLRHASRMYGATFRHLRAHAPNPESMLALLAFLEKESVPRWAKAGRFRWDDVSGLFEVPPHEETLQ